MNPHSISISIDQFIYGLANLRCANSMYLSLSSCLKEVLVPLFFVSHARGHTASCFQKAHL